MPFHRHSCLIALGLGLLAGPALADAQPAAKPAPARPPAEAPAKAAAASTYEITGFRSAKFGMTQAQVRQAIAADFPGARITPTANPVEGTQALQAEVAKLDPGPGPATVTYIFGATSKTLSHVNVVWALNGDPTAEQRAGIVTAAIQLTNYFQTLPEPPKATAGITPTGPNGLLLYAAVDRDGHAVEVAADGISYKNDKAPADKAPPEPKGPAILRVSYIANAANPDVVRIKPGSF